MLQLRWIEREQKIWADCNDTKTVKVLQYKTLVHKTFLLKLDADGALASTSNVKWTEWKDVPTESTN